MAIIGFVVLIIFGIYLTIVGGAMLYACAAFDAGIEYLFPIGFISLAAGVFYIAFKYAPFTITYTGT